MEICKNIKADDFIAAACGTSDGSCSWHLPARLPRGETAEDWKRAQAVLGSMKTWEIEKYVACVYFSSRPGYFSGRTAMSGRGCGGSCTQRLELCCWRSLCTSVSPPEVWGCTSVKPALQTRTLVLLWHLKWYKTFHTAENKLPTIRALTEGGAAALSTGCVS